MIAFFSYRKFFQDRNGKGFVIFNNNTGKWEATNKTNKLVREEILRDRDDSDGFNNKSIIRGYYDNYDEKTGLLRIKAVLPFTQNNLFEIIEAKIDINQTIYCVPETYTDPNNGKVFETRKLIVPIPDGQNIFFPTEKTISFDYFQSNSSELTYLLVQLTKNFSKDEVNYIQKVIVIGLCD